MTPRYIAGLVCPHCFRWPVRPARSGLGIQEGIWLYLYLVVDVWISNVLAWDVEQCEDAKLAAELVSRACPKERISRRRKQPLILHADNGNSLAAGFRAAIACCDTGDTTGGTRGVEILLQAAGEQRQPHSESLFRSDKYRPDYPSRPFSIKEEACLWLSSFVD
ncbi:hypothetical protein KBY79_11740 [Synechococcus lacustris C3-12m-Tous]|uniref:hypothetical protein n=1 Tax=Synechococcus lacustris TaxID=2116544 RepID=UPI0020CE1BBC|nr:hypothetical protein [Synechococcus lacustris]MCP9925879.1 hypothetical protein [Synechococcus lacustris C3-12m-Tous]